jgi:hypothetical protein
MLVLCMCIEKITLVQEQEIWFGLVLVVALRPQTPKHFRGGWSHYTDSSEPVDGRVGTLSILGAAGHIILTLANQLMEE